LQVFAGASDKPATTSIHLAQITRESEKQFTAKSPDPKVLVEVLDTRPVLQANDVVPADNGLPALRLTLQGPMMGRSDQAIFLGKEIDFGMATLKFTSGKPPAEPQPQSLPAS